MIGKILQIDISENPGGKMHSVPNVEAVAGKGLVNDRHHQRR